MRIRGVVQLSCPIELESITKRLLPSFEAAALFSDDYPLEDTSNEIAMKEKLMTELDSVMSLFVWSEPHPLAFWLDILNSMDALLSSIIGEEGRLNAPTLALLPRCAQMIESEVKGGDSNDTKPPTSSSTDQKSMESTRRASSENASEIEAQKNKCQNNTLLRACDLKLANTLLKFITFILNNSYDKEF